MNPNTSGGKNPPSPPNAPTKPVTVPVSFGKYSGTEIKLDGEEHLIMKEDDILGVIE